MSEVINIIIWWTGAVVSMALLAASTAALVWTTTRACVTFWWSALRIMQLSTARYWVDRMEREGLTVCRKEYRRMVAERKPKTPREYEAVEQASGIKGVA
jgi:hypothetical protein